nr:hypothetical protein [Micromonospora sp. DSM 115978]
MTTTPTVEPKTKRRGTPRKVPSTNRSVLFDVPGPKARRRNMIGSVIALVVIAWLVWVAVSRFADRGQLDGERWEFLTEPEILR